jgi:hypothetical protein
MKIKAFLLIIALLLTACGEPEPVVGDELEAYQEIEIPEELEEIKEPETVIIRDTVDEYNPLQFDFEEALNNIYIRGERMNFPKTPADFGEGFSFSDSARNTSEGVGVSVRLNYLDETVGTVIILIDCTIDNYDFNSEVIYIYRLAKR